MILEGDCLERLGDVPAGSVQAVITSPPYAERRRNHYGGIPAARYVDWWMKRADKMLPALKADGSLLVNIKEHCEGGQRSTYVLELVLAMVESGWRWIDEMIWHKPNPVPGEYGPRLKDGFERLLHFAPARPKFNVDAVEYRSVVPPRKGMNVTHGTARVVFDRAHGREVARPSNVFRLAIGGRNHAKHSAVMPLALARQLVLLLTDEGDTVLDPFAGSGTTLLAAEQLGRRWVGIDIVPEYVRKMRQRLAQGNLLR